MFKKLSAILVALLLAISCAAPAMAADAPKYTIEPVFLEIFDMSATEWYSDYTHKTLLATSIMLDIVICDYDVADDDLASAVVSGAVYVGQADASLYAIFFGTNATIIATYQPATGQLIFSRMDTTFSVSGAATAMSNMRADGVVRTYEKIENADVLEVYQMILDTLNNN